MLVISQVKNHFYNKKSKSRFQLMFWFLGLVFTESVPQMALAKPKLIPLKSVTLQKMEDMQAKAKERAVIQMEQDSKSASLPTASATSNVVSESISFE